MDSPVSGPVTVDSARLGALVRAILTGNGVEERKAALVAESLLSANLRGVDSHGVHLLPHYVKHLREGIIDAAADGRVVSESGSCVVFDGEHGIGQHVADACAQHAVRLARESGIGMVSARNSNHFGILATWGMRISREGMIGIVMCNASSIVPPWQGREGRVGTNPICVAVPSSGKGAWLLDMATTTVAKNKIVRMADNGVETIPAGWAMTPEGEPTTDAKVARDGLLTPLGGYKGSGLALMVEILCAVLSGGAMSTDVAGVHIFDRLMRTSQAFLAIDVTRFMPLEEFRSRMERLIPLVKSSLPARGFEEVLVAGDPEARFEAKRKSGGIPLDEETWRRLTQLAAELGIPVDE